MGKKLAVVLLVALVLPAAAMAKNVANARLTVHAPIHVGKAWVGSAGVAASKAEALQLQVCIESHAKNVWATIQSSCSTVRASRKAALVAKTKLTQASNVRTWAWVDVDGTTSTAVS